MAGGMRNGTEAACEKIRVRKKKWETIEEPRSCPHCTRCIFRSPIRTAAGSPQTGATSEEEEPAVEKIRRRKRRVVGSPEIPEKLVQEIKKMSAADIGDELIGRAAEIS
jgi:hypothetical protein